MDCVNAGRLIIENPFMAAALIKFNRAVVNTPSTAAGSYRVVIRYSSFMRLLFEGLGMVGAGGGGWFSTNESQQYHAYRLAARDHRHVTHVTCCI